MAVTAISRPIGIPQNPVLMLEGMLRPGTRALFRQLLHSLNPPIDAPNLKYALNGAVKAVKSYGTTLRQPSRLFVEQLNGLESLVEEVEVIFGVASNYVLESPLWRRLANYPAWALVLAMADADDSREECRAAGVEILHSLFSGSKFPKTHASRLRASLQKASQAGNQTNWLPRYCRSRREADRQFESDGCYEHAGVSQLAQERIKAELSRTTHFASVRHRQAVLDSRHQTSLQREISAAHLRKQVESGDESAMLVMLAERSGMGIEIVKDISIAGTHAAVNWIMLLDIDEGSIKTDLACLVKDHAKAPLGASCFRPACKVACIPLPEFLAEKLREKWIERSHANCVADLLPNANVNGRMLLIPGGPSGIAPSVGKFLESAAPYAIECGVDRLSSAILANDYSVIPNSKLYYCHVTHEEIWDSATVLYESMGWGRPVPVVEGIGYGSCIVPTREVVSEWFVWMHDQIDRLRPGRHCSLARLCEFHNVYARYCASILMFCFAAREVRQLRFSGQSLSPSCLYTTFTDKKGKIPKDIPVAICQSARQVIHYWESHLRALRKRLDKEDKASKGLKSHIDRVLGAGNVELVFTINNHLLPRPLGSMEVARWWPDQFKFSTDFGRHFWEVELRVAGLPSTLVDRHLRHVVQGMEPNTSTDDESLNAVLGRIGKAQDHLLVELGFCAIPGLARK